MLQLFCYISIGQRPASLIQPYQVGTFNFILNVRLGEVK